MKKIEDQITIGTNFKHEYGDKINIINIGIVTDYPLLSSILNEIECNPLFIFDGNTEIYNSFDDLFGEGYLCSHFYTRLFVPLSSIEKHSMENNMYNKFLEFLYDFISQSIAYEYVFRYNYIYNNAEYEEVYVYEGLFDNIENTDVDVWLKSVLDNIPEEFRKGNVVLRVDELKEEILEEWSN